MASSLLLSACGGGSTGNLPPIRTNQPNAAVNRLNTASLAFRADTPVNTRVASGTRSFQGAVATALTDKDAATKRLSALMAEGTMSVNFNTGTLSGTNSNFVEAVIVEDGDALTFVSKSQDLTGTLNLSGDVLQTSNRQALAIDTSGSLNGTMRINGVDVPGTYQVTGSDHILFLAESNGRLYAIGGPVPDQGISNTLTMVFQPSGGGAPVTLCLNGQACGSGGSNLASRHIYDGGGFVAP